MTCNNPGNPTGAPAAPKFGDAIEVGGVRPSWLPDDVLIDWTWDAIDREWSACERYPHGLAAGTVAIQAGCTAIRLEVPRYDFVYLGLSKGFTPWFGGSEPSDWSGRSLLFRCGTIIHGQAGHVWKVGWDHRYGDGDVIGYTSTAVPLAQSARPNAEDDKAEIKRLRELLIDPGSPPWEDARAVLVAELRKAKFSAAAYQVSNGQGCDIPSHIALNLIAQAARRPDAGDAIENAADILDQYAAYIATVKADDLERHPYLPSVEQAAQDLRAALSRPDAGDEDVERVARADGLIQVPVSDIQFCIDAIAHLKEQRARLRLETMLQTAAMREGVDRGMVEREVLDDLRNAGWLMMIGLNDRIKRANPRKVPIFYGIVELQDALRAADAALEQPR